MKTRRGFFGLLAAFAAMLGFAKAEKLKGADSWCATVYEGMHRDEEFESKRVGRVYPTLKIVDGDYTVENRDDIVAAGLKAKGPFTVTFPPVDQVTNLKEFLIVNASDHVMTFTGTRYPPIAIHPGGCVTVRIDNGTALATASRFEQLSWGKRK